jgi:hypothetical protein
VRKSSSPRPSPRRDEIELAASLESLKETMRLEDLEQSKEMCRKAVVFEEANIEFCNLMAWYESRKQVYYAQYVATVQDARNKWDAKEEEFRVRKAQRLEQMEAIERGLVMLQDRV